MEITSDQPTDRRTGEVVGKDTSDKCITWQVNRSDNQAGNPGKQLLTRSVYVLPMNFYYKVTKKIRFDGSHSSYL